MVSRLRSVPRQPLAVTLLAAVSGGTLALGTPASASAAVTIGQTGLPDATCANNDNITQTATGGPPSYTVPAGGGVITSWSFQGSPPDPGSGKMIVWRPTNVTAQFIVVGKTATESFSSALQTFATRIPVQGGETLGMRMPTLGVCLKIMSGPGDEVRYNTTATDPPDGSTQTLSNLLPQYRVLVAASVEPDCDSDGFGDETQDPELPLGEECGKGNRTLTLDANKNKVKKGKKVLLSGQLDAPGSEASCESSLAVELQRKKPTQTAFTTLEQLGTDAAGNFSTKEKVKKTFEFRAQVAETATCGAQVSNTEKVKVKKKK